MHRDTEKSSKRESNKNNETIKPIETIKPNEAIKANETIKSNETNNSNESNSELLDMIQSLQVRYLDSQNNFSNLCCSKDDWRINAVFSRRGAALNLNLKRQEAFTNTLLQY